MSFDGTDRAYDGPDPPPSDLELEIVNTSTSPALGVIFGVYDPRTTLEQAADFAAARTGRHPSYFTFSSVAPLPTKTSSIWVMRDLPENVTAMCVVTPSDTRELAGVRLPT